MVTLQDIADRADVAVSTVSRVLNGRPEARVTEPVRQRILAAADELGYKPNTYARGHGGRVTVVFWSAASYYSSRRVRAVESALHGKERPVMSIDAASLPRSPQALLDSLGAQLPDAVVLVGGSMHPEDVAAVVRPLQTVWLQPKFGGGRPIADMVSPAEVIVAIESSAEWLQTPSVCGFTTTIPALPLPMAADGSVGRMMYRHNGTIR